MRQDMKRLMGPMLLTVVLAAGTEAPAESGPTGPIEFIPADSLFELQQAGRVRLIVDVRTPDEFEAAHIRSAVNIPLRDLAERYREIPREGLVVLY